jgi:DNA replication licensing factor MCM7
MRAGLHHDTYLEAFKVTKDKQNFKESFLSEDAMEKVLNFKITCESDH